MQSPAASLSFILQRERFVSAYFVPRSQFTRREISRNFCVNPVRALIATETAHLFARRGITAVLHIFFRPRKFHRWFLSPEFAANRINWFAHATHRKHGKCVAHEMKTKRANYAANFPVECFVGKCEGKLSNISIRRSARDETFAIDVCANGLFFNTIRKTSFCKHVEY